MSYMPDLPDHQRLGAAEVAAGLALAYHAAHLSQDPALRDRTAYLGVLAFERLRPLLGYSFPGNLLSRAADNGATENFIWAASNADEAARSLTLNRTTRGAQPSE